MSQNTDQAPCTSLVTSESYPFCLGMHVEIGQKVSLSVGPCLVKDWIVSCFATVYINLTGLKTSGDSLVSASHSTVGALE